MGHYGEFVTIRSFICEAESLSITALSPTMSHFCNKCGLCNVPDCSYRTLSPQGAGFIVLRNSADL